MAAEVTKSGRPALTEHRSSVNANFEITSTHSNHYMTAVAFGLQVKTV